MKDETTQINRYLSGYENPEPPQTPPGKDGDPQIAALTSFLQTKTGFSSDSIVVDFGSGDGVLPYWMNKIWPSARPVPIYHAVDFQANLDRLSLPVRIHNRSKKIPVLEEFYESYLAAYGKEIELVVIRNVLHEMGIGHTAKLLSALTQYLKPGTEIYVQDMINLPRVEPGKAGWDPKILEVLFHQLGCSAEVLVLVSHGGTRWFAIRASTGQVPVPFPQALECCGQARQLQLERLLKEVHELNQENEQDSRGYLRLVLQNDVTAISIQLETEFRTNSRSTSLPIQASNFATKGLILNPSCAGPLDYAISADGEIAKVAGLEAVLSNKRMLDIGNLVENATRFVFFAGFSQHSFFKDEKTILAIEHLVRLHRPVRLLLVDPISNAAQARAIVPAYSGPQDLFQAIDSTISAAKECQKKLLERIPIEEVARYFSVALSSWTPPCSYFIIDNTCVVSLYSAHLTGSTGSCFVFRSDESATNSYYRVLRDDFNATWDSPMTKRLL